MENAYKLVSLIILYYVVYAKGYLPYLKLEGCSEPLLVMQVYKH